MTRAALEHIVRASAAVSDEREIVIIGSQAVLGQYPQAPAALLVSMEADVYPRYAPDKSALIDGAIGELSRFHETFGYYAHGIDETTATLPVGWEDRLVAIQNEHTGGAIGWCLEVHDLALSKIVAGRDKDLAFVRVLLAEGMATTTVLLERVHALPVSPARREWARAQLLGMAPADGAGRIP